MDPGQRILFGSTAMETTDRFAVGHTVGRAWVVVRISAELGEIS